MNEIFIRLRIHVINIQKILHKNVTSVKLYILKSVEYMKIYLQKYVGVEKQ